MNEQREPDQSDSQPNEYNRHPSPTEYVQMAPRNEEQTTTGSVYTYATAEGQQIICAESNGGTIKIETIEKDQGSTPDNQQQQQLQQQQQCPTPNGNYADSIVVSSSALHSQHAGNPSSSGHTVVHNSHVGAPLRFDDENRFVSSMADNGNGPPTVYYDEAVVDASTHAAANEGKTFTDLVNPQYISNFGQSHLPYTLAQGNAVYSVSGGSTTQILCKSDPNLGAIRQSQYQTLSFEPVNGNVTEQTMWPAPPLDYQNMSFVSTYNHFFCHKLCLSSDIMLLLLLLIHTIYSFFAPF